MQGVKEEAIKHEVKEEPMEEASSELAKVKTEIGLLEAKIEAADGPRRKRKGMAEVVTDDPYL